MTPAPTPTLPTRPTKPKDPMPPTKPTPAPLLNVAVPRSALLPALRAADEVAASNAPLRAYACVHLVASPEGVLTIRATNGRQAISRDVAATVKAPGFALLDASDLLHRVEAMSDGPVTLTERAGKVEMKAGAGRYTLPITAASEAPAIPSSAPEGHEVDAAALAALLDRLAPTMHDSPLEVTTHALHLTGDSERLTAQAFNGPSAGEASLTFDGTLDTIVPGAAVRQLVKVLRGLDGTVQLAARDRRLFVFGPLGLVYSTLLSEGPFPPVGTLWRPAVGPFLRVGREALSEALAAIRFDLHHDRVRLRPTAAGVTVHGLTQEGAEASSDVTAACSLEALSVTRAHLVRLLDFFADEETITLWSAAGDRREGGMPGPILAEADGARYLAMPLLFDALDLASASPAEEEAA